MHKLATKASPAAPMNIHSEISFGLISATNGDRIVMNLQNVWQIPYDVAATLTGKRAVLPIKAVLNALAIPNLPPRMKIESSS